MQERRFAEARGQCEQALALIQSAHERLPGLQMNLLLLADTLYCYGALLVRLGIGVTAVHMLERAREYFCRLEHKALLKGPRRTYQQFKIRKGLVDLEYAYLSLRQADYSRALSQGAQLLKGQRKTEESPQVRRLLAGTHWLMGWARYKQSSYTAAQGHAERALKLDGTLEEIRTLNVLIQARLLYATGVYEQAFSVGLAGCHQLLDRLDIDLGAQNCGGEEGAGADKLLHAIETALHDRQRWSRILPDEGEELGAFLHVLGAVQYGQGRHKQAFDFLLLAGSLLPQAETLDIAEFELLARGLGERAQREPLAFTTLASLVGHPCVSGRWEFLEVLLEALGQVSVGPSLALVWRLKTQLTAPLLHALPQATKDLIATIQTDLEQAVQVDGQTAALLKMRVLSDTSVRFALTAPFPQKQLPSVLSIIQGVIQQWPLTQVGMDTPEPATPETEQLTDLLEENLVQRLGH